MKTFASVLLFGAVPAFAFAGGVPHGGDVGVAFVAGRIVTSLVEEAGFRGGLGTPQRVFASELGSIEFGPFGNDEPGYTSNALAPDARIGFNILADLKRWNGSAFDGLIDETMQLARFLGTPGEEASVNAGGFVPGFFFAQADGLGFIDEHLSHILRGSDIARGFSDPSDGVYLLELELFTDAMGIANSDPYWIVFNLNQPEAEHDAAISYVETVVVPGPGAFALCVMMLACRRSRR